MTLSQHEQYPGWPEAAWLPAHDILAQREPAWTALRPKEVCSLARCPDSERLLVWRDALRQTFTELVPETAYADQFGGMIETVDRGGLRISRITADSQRVHRGAREIEQSKSDVFYLNVHLGGSGRVLHRFGATSLTVGDCILVDPGQPFVLEFGSAFRQLCVQIPEWCLREHLQMPLECAVGQRIGMAGSRGRVLLAALEMLLLETQDSASEKSSVALFMQVLSHNLGAISGSPNAGQGPAARAFATRLRSYVGQHFRNEDLGPADAASALNCSLRNIHKTCQGMGTTFGRLLLDARLSAAAQALACTGSPRARISDIAFGAGFSDISHFCKVFRLRFGVSPTEFRRQRC